MLKSSLAAAAQKKNCMSTSSNYASSRTVWCHKWEMCHGFGLKWNNGVELNVLNGLMLELGEQNVFLGGFLELSIQKFKVVTEIFNDVCNFKLGWSFEWALRTWASFLINALFYCRVELRLLLVWILIKSEWKHWLVDLFLNPATFILVFSIMIILCDGSLLQTRFFGVCKHDLRLVKKSNLVNDFFWFWNSVRDIFRF